MSLLHFVSSYIERKNILSLEELFKYVKPENVMLVYDTNIVIDYEKYYFSPKQFRINKKDSYQNIRYLSEQVDRYRLEVNASYAVNECSRRLSDFSLIIEKWKQTHKILQDFLNRSVDYFKSNETYDKYEFEEKVFEDSNVIKSFNKFKEACQIDGDIGEMDSFGISKQAVKKQARVFKKVLKLDKNFHIYIHGNKELIEQGVDVNGRKFYKIYYDEES